jgi:hypothetical protein
MITFWQTVPESVIGVLVPSLIEGLRVVQGLRIVPVFLYRYSIAFSLKKARSPGTTEGGRSDEALVHDP